MNYFAHAIRFLDRPYFLAGTALPDWLSVVDRRVRLRARNVEPFSTGSGVPSAEVAAGVLQHLEDDAWFHRTPAFAVASAELTVLFRAALPPDDRHRPAFLGHILTEMLLDAVLIERHPERLAGYYAALAQLDARIVEESANRMARNTTDRLQAFIPLFTHERFLADYLDSKRLLLRLNQIMHRVKLNPLPAGLETVLGEARHIVRSHARGLLPEDFVE
ncbi:MAG: hypothetical protein ACM3U2_13225 [Deltaproteobacteria bacterium]